MTTAPSKYASNQFDSSTVGRFPLLTTVLEDTHARFTAAAEDNSAFDAPLAEVIAAETAWGTGLSAIHNAEALQLSKTPAMEAKLASLTHKPDMETNSLLEHWDNVIRSVTPKGSSLYLLLLPYGRETLTRGSIVERVDALQDFATRLGDQAAYPVLTSLGAEEVLPFAESANDLRLEQKAAMAAVEELRSDQELLRQSAAATLYSAIAQGMSIFKDTPWRVDDLFDVNLLRSSSQEIPAAPIDTSWDAPTRTLSVTEMPAGATHLAAYRQGEGGAPELLAIGTTDELTVGIPSSFMFDPGESYDLWLVGKNSRGMGPAGPVVVWTLPSE